MEIAVVLCSDSVIRATNKLCMWNQQLWLHWLRVPHLPLLSQPTQVRRRAALCQQLGWTQVWYVSFLHKVLLVVVIAFSALTLLVGHREEHPPRKNWVIRCWCGYLSGEGADYLHTVGPMPLSSQNRVISCLIKILNVLPFCMGLSRLSWKKADKRVFVCFIPTITLFLFHSCLKIYHFRQYFHHKLSSFLWTGSTDSWPALFLLSISDFALSIFITVCFSAQCTWLGWLQSVFKHT